MFSPFRLLTFVVALIFLASWTSQTGAVTRNWIAGSGDWTNGANWSPAGAPQTGDHANISFGDSVARTVTFASAVGPLGTLTLDLTGSLTKASTLEMTGGELYTTTDRIGNFGRGVVNQA